MHVHARGVCVRHPGGSTGSRSRRSQGSSADGSGIIRWPRSTTYWPVVGAIHTTASRRSLQKQPGEQSALPSSHSSQ